MEAGVLDGELPHLSAGEAFAMEVDGEAPVVAEGVGLLVDCRRRQGRLAREERERLAEDPWITDRPAGDAQAVDAGLFEHRQAGRGTEQVPRSEHDP